MSKKVTEMTREELRDHMRANRKIHVFDALDVEWQRAFELARQNGLENMSMNCNSCIYKVHEWLSR